MATYNLRRFAHPDGLKAIAPKHLLAFLEPHRAYFASRGLRLPPPSAANGLDYERLVSVLSPGTPAMAAVWIILSKTRFPAELIESSPKHGVRTASVPFDISAEFIPDLLRGNASGNAS